MRHPGTQPEWIFECPRLAACAYATRQCGSIHLSALMALHSPRRASALVSVDQDLRWFRLRLLLDRHLEHAVLVAGRDPVGAPVVGQFERPANLSVATFRDRPSSPRGGIPILHGPPFYRR